jgi:hypothetical protein
MARRFRQTEAERLRQHNEEMKLALAENVPVLEARRRLAARSRRAFEASIERRQRCGTTDAREPSVETDYAIPLAYGGAPARQPYWWERD